MLSTLCFTDLQGLCAVILCGVYPQYVIQPQGGAHSIQISSHETHSQTGSLSLSFKACMEAHLTGSPLTIRRCWRTHSLTTDYEYRMDAFVWPFNIRWQFVSVQWCKEVILQTVEGDSSWESVQTREEDLVDKLTGWSIFHTNIIHVLEIQFVHHYITSLYGIECQLVSVSSLGVWMVHCVTVRLCVLTVKVCSGCFRYNHTIIQDIIQD